MYSEEATAGSDDEWAGGAINYTQFHRTVFDGSGAVRAIYAWPFEQSNYFVICVLVAIIASSGPAVLRNVTSFLDLCLRLSI